MHTHKHPFNGPLSGTTQVSRYQKGKINLDFTGAGDSEWQWHQLLLGPDRQPCQHPTTLFFTGRMPFLPPNQQRQSTEGTVGAIHAYTHTNLHSAKKWRERIRGAEE